MQPVQVAPPALQDASRIRGHMDSSTNLVVEAGLFNNLIPVALDEYLVNCKKHADRDIVPFTA